MIAIVSSRKLVRVTLNTWYGDIWERVRQTADRVTLAVDFPWALEAAVECCRLVHFGEGKEKLPPTDRQKEKH